MMRKLLFLMIVVMIAGCKPKPNSLGKLDEIYVFADSTDWQDYRDAIHSHFMKEYLTPVPEPEYIMKWRPFEDFSKYHYQNNVFFLARLNADDPVSKEINGLLGEDVVKGVKSGDYFYIPKKVDLHGKKRGTVLEDPKFETMTFGLATEPSEAELSALIRCGYTSYKNDNSDYPDVRFQTKKVQA